MTRERTNKLLTGLVTVTLVTGQIPAVSLAEDAETPPAGIEQGQTEPGGTDEAPEPAASDRAAGDANAQDGGGIGSGQDTENVNGNESGAGAEQPAASEPNAAQGEAATAAAAAAQQEPTTTDISAGTLHYNGAPATVQASVKGESGSNLDVDVKFVYSGTTYSGETYYSEDTAPTLPGEYEVTASFAGTESYAPSGAHAQLTITPRPVIVITYDADVVVSGDGDPDNLYEYGWSDQDANTEWAGGVSEEEKALGLTFTCAGAGAQVPGTYDILATTAHPELFDVYLMAGWYTVLPRLTVSAEHGTVSVTGHDCMAADNVDYGVKKGSKLTLSAGQAEDGWKFSGWKVVSGDATIADASAAETTLTAGQGNAVVEALYMQIEPACPTDPGDKPAAPDEPSTPSNPDASAPDAPTTPQAPSTDKPAAEKPAIPKTGDDTPDAAAPALAGGALALVAGAITALRRRLG